MYISPEFFDWAYSYSVKLKLRKPRETITSLVNHNRRSKMPCMEHRIASPDLVIPEIMGMMEHGYVFEKCSKCGWYAQK